MLSLYVAMAVLSALVVSALLNAAPAAPRSVKAAIIALPLLALLIYHQVGSPQ